MQGFTNSAGDREHGTAEHAAEATLAPADGCGSAFGLLAAVHSIRNPAASVIADSRGSRVSEVAFGYLVGWMSLGRQSAEQRTVSRRGSGRPHSIEVKSATLMVWANRSVSTASARMKRYGD